MTAATAEAWAEGRPIFERLPEAYRDDEIAAWLVGGADDYLTQLRAKIDISTLFNPLQCPADWLDYLATLTGFYGPYWDAQWPESGKRILINSAFTKVWPNAGTVECLSFILEALGIPNRVRVAGAFLIGISEVGDDIGYNPWSYEIQLHPSARGTTQENIARRVNQLWGPCWCSSSIIFDERIIELVPVLGVSSPRAAALLVGPNQILGLT